MANLKLKWSVQVALVNADGNVTYWSNDPVWTDRHQASVAVPVNGGLYAVLFGLKGRESFARTKLRVWFSECSGSSSVPYAFSARTDDS